MNNQYKASLDAHRLIGGPGLAHPPSLFWHADESAQAYIDEKFLILFWCRAGRAGEGQLAVESAQA